MAERLDDSVGARIQKARKLRGLSVPELAGKVGVSGQAVEAVEAGRSTMPSFPNGVRYAKALNVSVEWLALLSAEMGSYGAMPPMSEASAGDLLETVLRLQAEVRANTQEIREAVARQLAGSAQIEQLNERLNALARRGRKIG